MTSASILLIDDSESVLTLVARMLERGGFTVATAGGGADGLAKIRSTRFDAVFCDIMMPDIDGFEVLRQVRAEAATATLPFVLLTSMDDRDSVRRGMRLGADDFLTKPVKRQELIDAARLVLEKRARLAEMFSGVALAPSTELRERYAVAHAPADGAAAARAMPLNMTGRLAVQTVLFTDIRAFTSLSERLPAEAIAEFLTEYLREACRPVLQHGGRVMKIMGDGMMVLFGYDRPGDVAGHAAAGLRAGLGILQVAQQFRGWLAARYQLDGLPPFEVGVGVHTGEVMLFQLDVGREGNPSGTGDLTAVGDTVNIASRLEHKSKDLGWPLVASSATIDAAGPVFSVAQRREVEIAGRSGRIVVGQVIADSGGTPAATPLPLPAGIEAVLEENARSAASAAKEALDNTLRFAAGGEALPLVASGLAPNITVRGYKILSKIGEGGMSVVYLADDLDNSRRAVLKVLKVRRHDDEKIWERFFQESAILSSINHEHVVRVFDQGFGDELAYIAMEYLGGGSLRDVMDRGLSKRQALSLLAQAAGGLGAIHRFGIVHRDIKPANLMLRGEGVLVLTDFGVAKRLGQNVRTTLHGEVLGTPNYIAPEQVQGGATGPYTDIYSLGVIFYEMLTGQRLYSGETMMEILSQHMVAPIPRLEPSLALYQPLIDGMLAKRPGERFADTDTVLAEIDRVWTEQSISAEVARPAGLQPGNAALAGASGLQSSSDPVSNQLFRTD